MTSRLNPLLSPLGSYGGPTQTLMPLPGSPAICNGVAPAVPGVVAAVLIPAAPAPSAPTVDQRGNPRSTTYGSTTCVDTGAVETNYSLGFVTQPSDTLIGVSMAPIPSVQLNESAVPFVINSVALPLTLTGNGRLSGGTASTVPATGVASYSGLMVDTVGSGDTLTANLVLNGASTTPTAIAATSNTFNVTANTDSLSFTVADHTFGDAPFLIAATSASSGGFSYSVVSGPATVAGSTVTITGAGTVVLAANQAAVGTFAAGTIKASFNVAQAVPTVSWAQPAAIAFGTALSNTQLNATASVAGTFVYAPAAGSTPAAGVDSLKVTFTPTDAVDYQVVTKTVSLTVSQTGSSTTLTTSASAITTGASLTLTAQVSATGTPTGTVTFLDGTTVLGTVTLTNGGATYSTTALAAGTHTITAAYGGDMNFAASTSAASTVTVSDAGFTLNGGGTAGTTPSQTVTAGGVATFSFTIAPIGGNYPGAVTFTVSGLPTGAKYTLTPSTLAADAGQQTITLTIQTAAGMAMNLSPVGKGLAPFALALLLMPFVGAKQFRRSMKLGSRLMLLLLLAAGAAGVAGLTGCGGGGSSAPAVAATSKAYTVAVTAKSGSVSQTFNATLNVQQ